MVAVVAVVVRTCRMGTVRRVSGGSVRENRLPVAVVAVEVAVAVVVVVAGLGLPLDKAVLLLGHRPVRRLLRTWRAVEEERPRAGGLRGVFLRWPRLAPVAHNVSDAAVRLKEVEWERVAEERGKYLVIPLIPSLRDDPVRERRAPHWSWRACGGCAA